MYYKDILDNQLRHKSEIPFDLKYLKNTKINYYSDTKLKVNPIAHPDESNDMNRMDKMMWYVNRFDKN